MITATEVLLILSILVSLVTLYTFVKTKKKEAVEQGARQATLDSDIKLILSAVERLTKNLESQQREIGQLKLWLELLLQQHRANHNQDIGRSPQ